MNKYQFNSDQRAGKSKGGDVVVTSSWTPKRFAGVLLFNARNGNPLHKQMAPEKEGEKETDN